MPDIRPTVDPEEADFPPSRRRRAPASPRDRQAESAYDLVRLFVDLEGPTAPTDQSGFGSPHHPGWAVRRAFFRLESEGVLRRTEVPRRDERGRMVWYRYLVRAPLGQPGSAWRDAGNSVVWAEGAWRLTYFSFTPERILAMANEPRKKARRRNREAVGKNEFETAQTRSNGTFRGIYPARRRAVEAPILSLSMRARISQFFRSIKAVDWDGMAYVPVPGPALDAVLAWRASLPVAAAVPRPEERKEKAEERKTCRRCGVSFPLLFWKHKRSHALTECNLFLATRVMEE